MHENETINLFKDLRNQLRAKSFTNNTACQKNILKFSPGDTFVLELKQDKGIIKTNTKITISVVSSFNKINQIR